GIRPEHLHLAPDGALAIAADVVEALGADTLIHGRLGDNTILTIRLPGSTRVKEGDQLKLTAAPDNLHLFDRTSGARLG
ncbi:MAG: TOBE domain-containing protein, partial [Rhodospirillales bacterium]|nr:TOBE domain-containing protein [Rhodospirillales bacterium]